MELNGGSIIIMSGKNCFAIASDLRFGIEHSTYGFNTPKVFKIHKKIYIGMSGLLGDISTVRQSIHHKISVSLLKESAIIKPFSFSNVLSMFFYQHRFAPFLVETVIGGLDDSNNPFIGFMDMLGATSFSSSFGVAGTCVESLYGICENFWKPEMNQNELLEVISKCLILGLNRNCLSGWGGIVHIISPNKTISKVFKTRMD